MGGRILTGSPVLSRDEHLAALEGASKQWDVVVIGGGATGAGTAIDAASRGYRTLLLEQDDFGKGTSSRSTKLVHGGVRYLQQGNLSLVFEALQERGILLRNAPHVTRDMEFVVPCYRWWERGFYGTGLKIYDRMARAWSLGKSRFLSRREALSRLPTVRAEGLRGGVSYHDGQFDDARLVINLAQTAAREGAVVLNYVRVDGLNKRDGRIAGVTAIDLESAREHDVRARVVVNATGVFADEARRMDQPGAVEMIRPSQGVHIVLDREFLPGETGMMIPRTSDGRVLFALPWHRRLLLGTTDTPIDAISLEPHALEAEIEFLIDHAGRYLDRPVRRSDIRSVFAGLRPLVSRDPDGETSAISRDHVLHVSRSGLITITGGKWTTYRKMAEDTVDKAIAVGGLPARPCGTRELPIHGSFGEWDRDGPLDVQPDERLAHYGADASELATFMREGDRGEERIHPDLDVRRGEVSWAARREMARTVEDVLSRRTRSLVLDAHASREAASTVADLLAVELGHGTDWVAEQTRAFEVLAAGYLPDGAGTRAVDEPSSQNLI